MSTIHRQPCRERDYEPSNEHGELNQIPPISATPHQRLATDAERVVKHRTLCCALPLGWLMRNYNGQWIKSGHIFILNCLRKGELWIVSAPQWELEPYDGAEDYELIEMPNNLYSPQELSRNGHNLSDLGVDRPLQTVQLTDYYETSGILGRETHRTTVARISPAKSTDTTTDAELWEYV
ncbi:MAG: hypothetical protein MMC33_005001, partial [Icmadophila ericetorum]|nr:hypothetical protein [Icmadophila ericetorum]